MTKKAIPILVTWMVVAVVLIVQKSLQEQHLREFQECKGQLRAIGLDLEEYAVEHGSYPEKLSAVYGNKVLVCPSSGVDTYSGSYGVKDSGEYVLFCSGNNHQGYPENMPSASIPERGH